MILHRCYWLFALLLAVPAAQAQSFSALGATPQGVGKATATEVLQQPARAVVVPSAIDPSAVPLAQPYRPDRELVYPENARQGLFREILFSLSQADPGLYAAPAADPALGLPARKTDKLPEWLEDFEALLEARAALSEATRYEKGRFCVRIKPLRMRCALTVRL